MEEVADPVQHAAVFFVCWVLDRHEELEVGVGAADVSRRQAFSAARRRSCRRSR
jgi:hypothetical protein